MRTVATATGGLVEARAGAGTGAFYMLPDEAGDIAEPASRLLARHVPMGGTGRISDVGDLVELIVAGFGYLMNGLGRRAALLNVDPSSGHWVDEPQPSPPEPTPMPTAPPWPNPARPPQVGTPQ